MASVAARGFQYAGSGADIVAGVQWDQRGGTFTGGHTEHPDTRGIRPRGIAYTPGTTPGYQASPGVIGGTYGIPDPSVADLIDVDGFALVLENPSGSERLAFSSEQPAYRDVKSAGWTAEVNNMASWQATVPANDELFQWPFSDVVIAYDGRRRFHGILLPVEAGDFSDGEFTLSGFGPLYWAGHGDITLSYRNIAAYHALEDVWEHVARATNGRVRGNVFPPSHEHRNDHFIGSNGVEWTGTPLEILKRAHGRAGMCWSFDHSEQAAVAQSFVPGRELRRAEWQTTAINPSLSPEGYHNRVTVIGDMNANTGEPFSTTVSAPPEEIQQVTDGRILERVERNSKFQSDTDCHARATTLLAEDRGEYTIGGSLDVTPGVRRVVPGYTYRVPEFDAAAPAMFTPVWATLRQVSQSYSADEATVSLSFDDEGALVQHIRDDLLPTTAPRSVARRDTQTKRADPNTDAPENVRYTFGAGVWGTGQFGYTSAIDTE